MCYQFQAQIQNGSDEILIFIKEIQNCFPTITGAGVCTIDRNIFQCLMTTVFTYFIAAVQFNKEFFDKEMESGCAK